MKLQPPQKHNDSKKELMKYAGLGTQILSALIIAVFVGYKSDHWLKISFPLLIWLLPILFLFVIFYKLYKDTSKK